MDVETFTTFDDIVCDPVEWIKHEFKNYSQKENFTKELLISFNPLSTIVENKNSLETLINKIPNLQTLSDLTEDKGNLVQFKYLSTYNNVEFHSLYNTETKELNKYFNDYPNHENSILSEVLKLDCKIIPGVNPLLFKSKEDYENYNNLSSYKIIVYDYTNTNTKVNKMYHSIGLAYIDKINKLIYFHSLYDSLLNSYCNIKSPILKEDMIKSSRNLLKSKISEILETTDENLIEYIILSLMSKVTRVDVTIINYLPLNVYNLDELKVDKLSSFLKEICPQLVEYDLGVDELNKKSIIPTFNIDDDSVSDSVFQIGDESTLIINELNLSSGKLQETGCQNINFLNDIVENQVEKYSFPYTNGIEISIDFNIIILSNSKSILSKTCSTLLHYKYITCEDFINKNEMKIDESSDCYQQDIINYILSCKSLYETKFEIGKEVNTLITNDFISMRKENVNFSGNDLSLLLSISTLLSISYGRNYMLYEDFEKAKQMEKGRLKLNK